MFWCIIWFYLRAAPREETVVEKNLEEDRRLDLELYNLVDSIRSHSFDGLDRRVSILDTSKDAWANQFLHPKLAFVAPLLVELAEQIRPDYRRLKPAPDPVHLHEAVSRILLKYIVQWEDDGCDVELDTERRRDVSRADAQREKRKASEEAEDSRGKRHRQD
ncbi:hypothetical protein ONZ45_g15586 [Pleurotus djamor]|nr:hypothetical protein ONZ45_g15586 [Pleurotus djamor]